MRLELRAHRGVGLLRLGLAGSELAAERDQVQQHPAALDVGEELVPQPGPRGGALDQPRDVGEHELALAVVDRPEDRLEGRERVAGDLRRCPRQPPEQRRLARVREPDQPHVGDQLQPQLDPPGLAGEPALGKARRLPGRGGKALVAVPPHAALSDDRALTGLDQVVAPPLEPLDLSPGRHRHDDVVAARAVALLALPVAAAPRPLMGREAQRGEVAPRFVADQDHVAAAAAVAAVGPAARHVRLAAERDHAVAAGAGLDVDLGPVVEHRLHRSRGNAQRWTSRARVEVGERVSSSARASSEIVSSGIRPSASASRASVQVVVAGGQTSMWASKRSTSAGLMRPSR